MATGELLDCLVETEVTGLLHPPQPRIHLVVKVNDDAALTVRELRQGECHLT